MPKTLALPSPWGMSGIDITYTKSTRLLYIGGWYDSMVGIQPERHTLSLTEFCTELGIDAAALRRVVREMETPDEHD